ncbi:hypothetical protein [Streptomyces globisporus]|uniref:hypothetical protein n=1 Tax=Streptomyces globisporus TaxID=1908 RepID=UPI0034614B19|nr:hypothetical protein OG838_23805 [Streptomyces globisporus]
MTPHTAITAAILGVLPGATPDARVTVEQPLQVGRDTWTGTVTGLAQRIADATEGKDTQPGESTPTISARDARTAVLVSIARALREQPTGAQLLDGLHELGEAVVCDDVREIAAWADALASLAHIDDDLGVTAAQPPAAHTDYRAEHESIHVGHYTTETAARRHCEALVSNEHPADRALVFDWIGDEDDPEEPRELTVQVDGGDEELTGYVVVPLAVAAEHDPDAE